MEFDIKNKLSAIKKLDSFMAICFRLIIYGNFCKVCCKNFYKSLREFNAGGYDYADLTVRK